MTVAEKKKFLDLATELGYEVPSFVEQGLGDDQWEPQPDGSMVKSYRVLITLLGRQTFVPK